MFNSKDFASIHAYLCADGYVIKNPSTQEHKYYRIGLRNTNKVLLKDFQNKFFKVFKKKPRLIIRQRCEIGSKEIYYKLINKYSSFYSREWSVPKLSKEIIKSWLRSFFDCESWVVCRKAIDRHIGLDSVNNKGLIDVKRMLLLFKIRSKIKTINNRNIYRLHIFGKDNLLKFQREIGFLHPDKKRKLEDVVKSYVYYVWKFNDLKRLIKIRARIKKPYFIRITSCKKYNIETMSKILKLKYNINSKIYQSKNGLGNLYYFLMIHKKSEVIKFVNNNLLSKAKQSKIQHKLFK